ncbi:receptor-like serine/threonine-protein kinase ALE2 isoform X1 [Cryptomeria japonica]|uniref:receptor-like serine/threonine-protein kinase ALE2 isoform X1 n=1 Tax=Cryptomeria japonica TaxID=3369 RepID=UPI0027DA53CE|nr:receptor-like serine/threonine-protein kinase ALE2 isoform X1 [Cryptomeria japonica]
MRIVCNAFFHRAILSLSLMEMMKARKSVAVDQSISTLDLCTFSVCAEKIRFLFRRLLVFIRFRLTRLFLFEMVHPALQGQFSTKGLVQVAAIAAMFVQPEADYHPFMRDVVQSLNLLVRQYSRSENYLHFSMRPI